MNDKTEDQLAEELIETTDTVEQDQPAEGSENQEHQEQEIDEVDGSEEEQGDEQADGEEQHEDDPLAFLDAPAQEAGNDGGAEDVAAQSIKVALDVEKSRNEELQKQLDEVRQQLSASEGVPQPDVNLINPEHESYDPDAYNKQMFAYQQHQATKLQTEQQLGLETQQRAERFVQERDSQLQRDMPFLFEGERGRKAAQAISDEAMRSGLPQDQVWALSASMVKTFYNSLQWQASQRARKDAETNAKKDSPRPVKPLAKGKPKKGQDALKKLASTGSEDAAVEYLMNN